jgi:hypothetical protein
VGIRRVINGPFTFAPDGNPLIGPIRGLSNHWVACGVMAGFSQGGGVGLALANWMIDGDPGFDVWAMDVARFGDWASPAYTNAKVRENYSRRFRIRFPNEELPAARPLRTTPVYDTLKGRGAVFGARSARACTVVRAAGMEPREDVTYRRSNAHGPVGEECRAVRERSACSRSRRSHGTKSRAATPDLAQTECLQDGCRAQDASARADAQRQGQADRRLYRGQRGRRSLFRLRVGHRRAVSPPLARCAPAAHGVGIRSLADEWMGFAVAGRGRASC